LQKSLMSIGQNATNLLPAGRETSFSYVTSEDRVPAVAELRGSLFFVR